MFFTKWSFPHYFAPAARLVWYLQTEGLRQIWQWNPHTEPARALTWAERRAITREGSKEKRTWDLRPVVYVLPALCVISLVLRVESRLNGGSTDPHGPDRFTLFLHDWAMRRAELDHWIEQQANPQLVFVRYSRWHNVNCEWVYNHPDIIHSHVIWARDLGAEHNKLLLNLLSDRSVWLLDADAPEPQLVSYAQALSTGAPSQETPGNVGARGEQDEQANW